MKLLHGAYCGPSCGVVTVVAVAHTDAFVVSVSSLFAVLRVFRVPGVWGGGGGGGCGTAKQASSWWVTRYRFPRTSSAPCTKKHRGYTKSVGCLAQGTKHQ